MKGGYRGQTTIMLRALCKIKSGEEFLVYYNEHAFGEGNEHCLCGQPIYDGSKARSSSSPETSFPISTDNFRQMQKPEKRLPCHYKTRSRVKYAKVPDNTERLFNFYGICTSRYSDSDTVLIPDYQSQEIFEFPVQQVDNADEILLSDNHMEESSHSRDVPENNELYQTAVPVPETEFSVQIADKLGDALVKKMLKICPPAILPYDETCSPW